MILKREAPLVYLISDGSISEENFSTGAKILLEIVRSAVSFNIPLIQIREKKITGRRLFELARSAKDITVNSETKVLVNDRVDIAIAAGADGVHLPSRSIPVNVVRKHVPDNFLIGLSTHSSDELAYVQNSGADFAVFGPVFDSPGKGKPAGLEQLHQACSAVPGFPVLGLGGINATNFRDVLSAGAAGFAAIRFLNDHESLKKVSRELQL